MLRAKEEGRVETLLSTWEEAIFSLRKEAPTSSWASEAESYVPLRGSYTAYSPDGFALNEKLNEFLASKKKVLLLLGDSGSGKSLTTQRLLAEQWKSYAAGSMIPLWISLPSLVDPIHTLMQETLAKGGWSEEAIDEARRTQSFLLILDGYDEIRQWQNLYVTNKLEQWQVKVIITCRREYIYHQDDYSLHFMPFAKERAQRAAYEEIVVKPFSREQIDQYLQQVVSQGNSEWQDWQEYRDAIDAIPGLQELLATPFMLKMAIDILPRLLKEHQGKSLEHNLLMTQARLYDAFIEYWFERQERKLKEAKQIAEEEHIKPAFWAYAKALAKAMHEENITVVHYQAEGYLLGENNVWDQFFNPELEQISLLQTACLVREVAPSHYAFIHASFIEYFVTRSLYEEILIEGLSNEEQQEAVTGKGKEKVKEKEEEVEGNKPSAAQAYLNSRLLVQDAGFMQMSADRVWQGKEGKQYKAWLFGQIESSKNKPDNSHAAANAITILNRAKVSFSGMDLSNTNIPGADLSHVLLSGADLSNADLTGVKLNQAYLAHTNFTYACLRKVNFAQSPALLHKKSVSALSYSANGRWLATACGKKITIWDTLSGEQLKQLKEQHTVEAIAFSPDSQQLASASWHTIRLWNLIDGKEQKILNGHTSFVESIAFSPTGLQLASLGSFDKTIWLWNLDSGQIQTILNGHTSSVTSIAFSPDGCQLASAGDAFDKTIRLWNVKSGDLEKIILVDNEEITALAFSPDGCHLVSNHGGNSIYVWDVKSGELQKTLLDSNHFGKDIAFHPRGQQLATTSDNSKDSRILLWDIKSGKPKKFSSGHTNKVTALAFNPNGRQLASCSSDKTVRLWPVEISQLQLPFSEHKNSINAIAFSPDGCLAWSSKFHSLKLWKVESNLHSCKRTLHRPPLSNFKARDFNFEQNFPSSDFNTLAFNTDGCQLASGSRDGTIELWDVKSGMPKELHVGQSHTLDQEVRALAFSRDGRQLASGSNDKTLRLWDVESGELQRTFSGYTFPINLIAFSPDGCQLALGSSDSHNVSSPWGVSNDNTIRLWDIKSGEQKKVFSGHTDNILAIAFSPNGGHLASGGNDKIVLLWDIESEQPIATLNGHINAVNIVHFSPDGRQLISGDISGTLHLWDITTHSCLAILPTGGKVIEAIHWHIASQQLWVVDNYRYLFRWQLPQTVDEPYALLQTDSIWPLTCMGLNIEKTVLSVGNQTLLQQLGAIGNPQLYSDSVEDFSAVTKDSKDKEVIYATNLKENYSSLPLSNIAEFSLFPSTPLPSASPHELHQWALDLKVYMENQFNDNLKNYLDNQLKITDEKITKPLDGTPLNLMPLKYGPKAKESAIKIQTLFRGFRARKNYRFFAQQAEKKWQEWVQKNYLEEELCNSLLMFTPSQRLQYKPWVAYLKKCQEEENLFQSSTYRENTFDGLILKK